MTLAGWMIITAAGTPMWALTRPTRREAIAAFEELVGSAWKRRTKSRANGWRCVRVFVRRNTRTDAPQGRVE